MRAGEGQRERETESQAGTVPPAVEPDWGLELMNPDQDMSWNQEWVT